MNNPIVTMEARICIHLRKPFNEKTSLFDVGGFGFVVDNRDIPFDFDASGYSVEETSVDHKTVTICFYTGEGPFFNDWHLSEDFDADYQMLGLKRDLLTAKYLANTTAISEFFVNAEVDNVEALLSYKLLAVSLRDDSNEFYVNKAVLDEFNYAFPCAL